MLHNKDCSYTELNNSISYKRKIGYTMVWKILCGSDSRNKNVNHRSDIWNTNLLYYHKNRQKITTLTRNAKKPRTLETVGVAKEDAVSRYRNFSRRYPNAFARKA